MSRFFTLSTSQEPGIISHRDQDTPGLFSRWQVIYRYAAMRIRE